MIPKTIHYCWFGRGEKPKLAQKCIASWKKFCPDYEIIEWNEDNFDVHKNCYTEEAYNSKKYAFVTDFVRLYVLYNYGGIYMDTDVELLKPLDSFLRYEAFSGFESAQFVPTGLMAAKEGVPIIGELLDYYNDKHFVKQNGELDLTTNCVSITQIMCKHGLKLNGQFQTVNGFTLFPQEYFCPFINETGELKKTEKTVAIHWFNKSWLPLSTRIRSRITRVFHRFFGVDCFRWLKKREY